MAYTVFCAVSPQNHSRARLSWIILTGLLPEMQEQTKKSLKSTESLSVEDWCSGGLLLERRGTTKCKCSSVGLCVLC